MLRHPSEPSDRRRAPHRFPLFAADALPARWMRRGRRPDPASARVRSAAELLGELVGEATLLARAEDELARVHAREVARLLSQAALLVGAAGGDGSLASPDEPPPSLAAWRREVRRVLRLGEVDGLGAPGSERLAALVRLPLEAWSSAATLARAATLAWDGEGTRLCLGRALLREGRAAQAARVFAALLRRESRLSQRWRALEGLGAAHAALGRHRLAMGAMDAAADDPACGVEPLVSGLYLAWRARDLVRARRAAARLDILVDPAEPAFLGALERLRRWHAEAPPPDPGAEREGVVRLCRQLSLAPSTPAGRVCRLFLEPRVPR